MTRAVRIIAACCCAVFCVGIAPVWLLSYESDVIFSVRLNATERLQLRSERGQLVWNWHRRFPGEVTGLYNWRVIPFEDPKPFYHGDGRRIWPPEPSLLNFALGNKPDAWRGVIPHWFALLVAGALAAGLHPAARWRFKTRDLLVITTLAAVFLTLLIVGGD